MARYMIFLVLSSLTSSMVNGRSWRNDFPKGKNYGDRGIVFAIPHWHHEGRSSEDWGYGSDSRETDYKWLRKWNPDRVWFPDFGDKVFSSGTPSTQPIQVVTPTYQRNVDECISQCPTTSEYNPVCGTNRVTYNNLGRLECARYCGVDVKVLRKLPCSLVFQEQSTTEATQTVEEQRRCIQDCPTTPEYNPICGTNNVTYQNRGRLECAKFCGVDVEVKRLSPCPTPITTEPPINEDLFNSDQSQFTTRATSKSDTFSSSTIAPDKPSVTIPQEILNEIFNIPTDDSNDVDIDIRKRE
ncbi:unnamed protein product, partial [Iphiclides podalirius]